MRLPTTALLLCLAAPLAAQGQTPLTGTTGVPTTSPAVTTPGAAAPARHRMTLEERFDAANTTHDGHLTQEQARSGMPAVAHRFEAIDTAHQGYVTLDQIRDYQREQRAERRAARKAAATTAPAPQ